MKKVKKPLNWISIFGLILYAFNPSNFRAPMTKIHHIFPYLGFHSFY